MTARFDRSIGGAGSGDAGGDRANATGTSFREAFAGSLVIGTERTAGPYHTLCVMAFSGDGGGVMLLSPRFTDASGPRRLAARLRLRSGRAATLARSEEAESAILEQAVAEGIRFHHQTVGHDAVREALEDYAAGGELDVTRIVGDHPGYEAVAACEDGSAWVRVLTLAAAAETSAKLASPVIARFPDDLAVASGDVPDAGHYVLITGGGPEGVPVSVRIPGPDADPFEMPELSGGHGDDPFPAYVEHIAVLSTAVDVMLAPRHAVWSAIEDEDRPAGMRDRSA